MNVKLNFNRYVITGSLLYITVLFVTLFFVNTDNSKGVEIGFVHNGTAYSNYVLDEYAETMEGNMNIKIYETEEKMILGIEKNEVDCGYVLPDEFENKIGTIKSYYSDKSYTRVFNNIILDSIHMKSMAGILGAQVLEPFTKESEETIQTAIDAINREYLAEGDAIKYKKIETNWSADGDGLEAQYVSTLLSGLSSIFLILLVLFFNASDNKMVDNFNVNRFNLINRRLGMHYISGKHIFYLLYYGLIITVSLFIIDVFMGQGTINIYSFLGVLLLSAFMCNLTFATTYIINKNLSICLLVAYFIGSFVFGTNVFNAGGLQYLFSSYYFMEIISGSKLDMVYFTCINIAVYCMNNTLYFKTNNYF